MTVPSRPEAARLLCSLQPPDWLIRHSCAVADVAAWLARRVVARGRALDVTLVETAALLHDVDKALPPVDPAAHLPHGEGSAAWLESIGYGELGPLVRDHPVTRLALDEHETWMRTASLEARVVAYADKRAGGRLESMEARFASWRRRYPGGPQARVSAGRPAADRPHAGTDLPGAALSGRAQRAGWDQAIASIVRTRADALEAQVCAAAGVHPGDVRRLRWARRAVRAACAETRG
jgi:putative nucleotidyltransferase with HDIG domain